MSSGLSVRLPLEVSETFGPYGLIQNYVEMATQNLKMLILTSQGERMMDPAFGVGLKSYAFELNDTSTYMDITTAIQQQTQKYLNYITIEDVRFSTPENNPDLFPHDLTVSILFSIVSLNQSSVLEIQVNRPI
tara:strand:- start:7872 stop:8270 length:399 start_codon:yes stop_codon:yes gene_type:complete